jgi:hypothetical protein
MIRSERRRLCLHEYLRGASNCIAAGLLWLLGCAVAHSAPDTVTAASAGSTPDTRLRSVVYSADQVYPAARLRRLPDRS